MKAISKTVLFACLFFFLPETKAQTGAYAYLSIKGIRGSSISVNINGAESGKVLPGLSKQIPISKPGNLQIILTNEQGNRFDTTIIVTENDANKTLAIRFPETSAIVTTTTTVTVNPSIVDTTPSLPQRAPEPGPASTPNENDKDDDGVPDNLDREPNTPRNAVVDVRGRAVDTDGDGVPDYKDKEKLTQAKCFPVTSDGIGSCPEPASIKALSAALAKMEEKISLLEKQSKGGTGSSAALVQSVAGLDPRKQTIDELKKLAAEMKSYVALAELHSMKAQTEAQEAEQASQKAQSEALEAEQASQKAQAEAVEATNASEKAQFEAKEATQYAEKAENGALDAAKSALEAKKFSGDALDAANKAKNALTKPTGHIVQPKQNDETIAKSATLSTLQPEKKATTKK